MKDASLWAFTIRYWARDARRFEQVLEDPAARETREEAHCEMILAMRDLERVGAHIESARVVPA